MASSLDEAHTNFLTPRQFQAQEAQLSGDEQYEGIGARLSNNPLVVDYVFPGSPAEAAGLRAGDQILSIDGQPAGDMRAEEAVGIVRGPAGTTVTLQIRRPGATADMTIAIVRGTIQIPNLVADVMDDVGVLRLSSFPATRLDEDVAAELARFNDMGAKALVLDLRGNPGGRLDTGVRIASLFLRNGAPVYRETTRSGRMTMRVSSAGPMWTKPIVVLIDRGTASMGELLAAALKEQAGATLIGSNTAGAVAGSITVPLSDGSAMQITTVRIDSSLGAMLNVDGIHPDVNVSPRDPGASRATDPVLDAALTYLRGRVTAPTGAELPAQGSEAVLVAA
jgi:carboxyl-terminal processing protease